MVGPVKAASLLWHLPTPLKWGVAHWIQGYRGSGIKVFYIKGLERKMAPEGAI